MNIINEQSIIDAIDEYRNNDSVKQLYEPIIIDAPTLSLNSQVVRENCLSKKVRYEHRYVQSIPNRHRSKGTF